MIFNSPVYPIPPSFDDTESNALETESTKQYIQYLNSHGASHIMTTAGTSQFNLLSINEVRQLNETLITFPGNKIIGIPPLSLKHTLEELEHYNSMNIDSAYILVLFPERYYTHDQLVEYFTTIAKNSKYPVLAHGNPIRKGSGGTFEFDNELLSKFSKIKNFIGIKEETSSINLATSCINGLDLEIIVAGGSMKRFWCLQPFGATTYLSGVGSFFPEYEEEFYRLYNTDKLNLARKVINEVETPMFQTFMDIGWHACMRAGLKYLGLMRSNRLPFHELSVDDRRKVESGIDKVKQRLASEYVPQFN